MFAGAQPDPAFQITVAHPNHSSIVSGDAIATRTELQDAQLERVTANVIRSDPIQLNPLAGRAHAEAIAALVEVETRVLLRGVHKRQMVVVAVVVEVSVMVVRRLLFDLQVSCF